MFPIVNTQFVPATLPLRQDHVGDEPIVWKVECGGTVSVKKAPVEFFVPILEYVSVYVTS